MSSCYIVFVSADGPDRLADKSSLQDQDKQKSFFIIRFSVKYYNRLVATGALTVLDFRFLKVLGSVRPSLRLCKILVQFVTFRLFSGHHVWHILGTCIVKSIVPPAGWFSRTVKLSRYHGYHIFVHLCRIFRHSGSGKLYICTETSVSSINLIEVMYLHFPNFVSFLNEQWQSCAYYLLKADSIQPMRGTCQKEVNYHWFSCDSWRPKGARHVWGRSVKCLTYSLPVSFPSLKMCSIAGKFGNPWG